VGFWYEDFGDTPDDEVRDLLASARAGFTRPPGSAHAEEVRVPCRGGALDAELALPPDARGVVVFVHGSGSGRRSPRSRAVARHLNEHRLGTLLIDLLTAEEERIDARTRALRFDVELLAERTLAALDWLSSGAATRDLPLALHGASTGAAAAIRASAARPALVRAIVSRGGRPDLAGAALSRVGAPVLLIVGGDDREVLELNRRALAQLGSAAQLEIVPGASHLFAEPGKLAEAATLARDWLLRHLSGTGG
jgi:putative phosphoribosyl transferase